MSDQAIEAVLQLHADIEELQQKLAETENRLIESIAESIETAVELTRAQTIATGGQAVAEKMRAALADHLSPFMVDGPCQAGLKTSCMCVGCVYKRSKDLISATPADALTEHDRKLKAKVLRQAADKLREAATENTGPMPAIYYDPDDVCAGDGLRNAARIVNQMADEAEKAINRCQPRRINSTKNA